MENSHELGQEGRQKSWGKNMQKAVEARRMGSLEIWVLILVLPLTYCVILSLWLGLNLPTCTRRSLDCSSLDILALKPGLGDSA